MPARFAMVQALMERVRTLTFLLAISTLAFSASAQQQANAQFADRLTPASLDTVSSAPAETLAPAPTANALFRPVTPEPPLSTNSSTANNCSRFMCTADFAWRTRSRPVDQFRMVAWRIGFQPNPAAGSPHGKRDRLAWRWELVGYFTNTATTHWSASLPGWAPGLRWQV